MTLQEYKDQSIEGVKGLCESSTIISNTQFGRWEKGVNLPDESWKEISFEPSKDSSLPSLNEVYPYGLMQIAISSAPFTGGVGFTPRRLNGNSLKLFNKAIEHTFAYRIYDAFIEIVPKNDIGALTKEFIIELAQDGKNKAQLITDDGDPYLAILHWERQYLHPLFEGSFEEIEYTGQRFAKEHPKMFMVPVSGDTVINVLLVTTSPHFRMNDDGSKIPYFINKKMDGGDLVICNRMYQYAPVKHFIVWHPEVLEVEVPDFNAKICDISLRGDYLHALLQCAIRPIMSTCGTMVKFTSTPDAPAPTPIELYPQG